jgi:CRP-like cAMP-binding protein
MDAARLLVLTQLFQDLAPRDVLELLPLLRERDFERGESLWSAGDPADKLYILTEGQLKSYRVSRKGAEVILLIQSAPDTAGEVGLFHAGGVRLVNVAAMTRTRCLTLSRAQVVGFLSRHPVTMERMLERLSRIAERAANAFTGVAFDDIRRRAAAVLLALSDEFGEPVSDGVRIRIQLSQATLAALIAASREHVNRSLSGLVTAGVISQHGMHFVVHDRRALQESS